MDDHPVVREGLIECIERQEDMTLCGEADCIAAALRIVEENEPDVAIVDITLGEESGFELIQDLTRDHPAVKILVLSMHNATMYVERAIKAGAKGYVMKEEGTRKAMEGVRKVMAGEIFMRNDMLQQVLTRLADVSTHLRGEKKPRLTEREFQILRLTGLGFSTRSIAEKLNRSHKTVEAHKATLKEKLELDDAEELLQYAIEWVRMEDKQA